MTTPAPTTAVIASYETLRRVALGDTGPCDGPSLGFALLLRQGLAAWLEAWAMRPGPMVPPVRRAAPADILHVRERVLVT
jgi:hypothetical protein